MRARLLSLPVPFRRRVLAIVRHWAEDEGDNAAHWDEESTWFKLTLLGVREEGGRWKIVAQHLSPAPKHLPGKEQPSRD